MMHRQLLSGHYLCGYRFHAVEDVTVEQILSKMKESVLAPRPPPKGLAQPKTSFFVRKREPLSDVSGSSSKTWGWSPDNHMASGG